MKSRACSFAVFSGWLCYPEMSARFQKVESADNVRLDKIPGPGNGAVDMRLGRQVQHMRDGMLSHDPQHLRLVSQIHFFESVFGVISNLLQVCRVARICETVEVNKALDLGALDDVLDQV